jgi:uncharacterized protein (TIGR02646 family)
MIAIIRYGLPTNARTYLAQRSFDIESTTFAQRRERSDSLWQNKNRERMTEVRDTLRLMCSGNQRCMYCEDSAATDIDHFRPRSTSPLLTFAWENYLLACSMCNSNFKRQEFPCGPSGDPYLIDPTVEDPATLLIFSPSTGRYEPISGSTKAVESLRVFGINRPLLQTARRDAWRLFQLIIVAYGAAISNSDNERAQQVAQIAQRQPLAGVLRALVTQETDIGVDLIDPDCRRAIDELPEVQTWIAPIP